jgi:hypothetical protein
MQKQPTIQLEDGGSNPTPSLQTDIIKAHQRIIREQINEDSPIPKEQLKVKRAIVKEISKEFAKTIILKYEWLGTMANTSHHFGIFFDDHCAGVVCYGNCVAGNPNINQMFKLKKEEVWILARGACVSWAPVNTNSKLIGRSLRLLKEREPQIKVIVAYTDPSAGEIGTIYQSTNWIYLGFGRSRTCVMKKDGTLIHSRTFSNQSKFFNHSKIKAMEYYVKNNPGSKIYYEKDQPKKGRYIYVLDDENKSLKDTIQKYVKAYPKR